MKLPQLKKRRFRKEEKKLPPDMDLRDQNNGCVRLCYWKTQFYMVVHEQKSVLANPMMRYLFHFMCVDFYFEMFRIYSIQANV